MVQEGYGSAFLAHDKDYDSIVTTITSFAERASENESKLSEMVNELLELKAAMAAMMTSAPPFPGAVRPCPNDAPSPNGILRPGPS